MKTIIVALTLLALVAAGIIGVWQLVDRQAESDVEYQAKVREYVGMDGGKVPRAERRPNDWFYTQRAFPVDSIPRTQVREAIVQAGKMRASRPLNTLSSTVWEAAGPENIPGRVIALAVDPTDPNTIYAAQSSGGIDKSTDLGQTWEPIFDDQGCPPVGALAIDPTRTNIVYAGTGEANPTRSSYEGIGLFKSTDAGENWTLVGLPNSGRIGRIIVDPIYPETLYVAVYGTRFSGPGPDRGFYRSLDGGANWEQTLFVADDVGCIDAALHPASGVVLAAMWQRDLGRRSGIYRSADRGATWTEVTGTGGLPSSTNGIGRIGLCMEPTTGTAYAMWADPAGDFDALYKSIDTGQTWVRTNDAGLEELNASWSGGWFFGQIRVAPGVPDQVYPMGLDAWHSLDGGNSYFNISAGPTIWDVHVDQHALVILESDPNVLYLGNDGGVYYTENRGGDWTHFNSMANDQFYAIEIDHNNPERLYGGTQDNGTLRTMTGGTDDWERVFGGDGFYCIVDYTDPNRIFVESQYGNLVYSLDCGQSWYWGRDGINTAEGANWCTPYIMDPNNHELLYYGTNRVYQGQFIYGDWLYWESFSPPLTWGTVTTIDVGRTDGSVVFAGTSDGEVWGTTDAGVNWTLVSTSLPVRYITRVTIDPFDASIIYVTLSGYRQDGDLLPHVYRSTDYGASWTSIHGDLPDAPVNDLIVDFFNDSTLYIATDVGVFVTTNLGTNWQPFGTGMPIVPVHDLDYHMPTRMIVAGTYGRSMFTITHPCDDPDDSDSDGTGDACDNCPGLSNPDQADIDYDLNGDLCDNCVDPDLDGYGSPGYPATTCSEDNCPDIPNANQADFDSDGIGDVCDDCPVDAANDGDADGLCANEDNCPDHYNPGQEDIDEDGIGDLCDACVNDPDNDGDADGYCADEDNCPEQHNPGQEDQNGDGVGDLCCCGHFADGYTGNTNCSDDGKITLSDISRLIDYVFVSKAALCCEKAGNANGDEEGNITLADISRMIDNVYISKNPTALCATP